MLEVVGLLLKSSVSTLAVADTATCASREGNTFDRFVPSFSFQHNEPFRLLPPREDWWVTTYGRQSVIIVVDRDFPNTHRADLPEHEREVSAEALNLLHRGVEDVKAGRVRALDLDELKFAEDD